MKYLFKLMLLWLVIVFFFLAGPKSLFPVWAEENPLTVILNGNSIVFDVPPFIDDRNRTMVPLRFIAEELGSTVDWNEANQEITLSQGIKTIKLRINQPVAIIDDREIILDTVPVIVNSRAMVPLRFVGESFDALVNWDGDNFTVNINTAGPDKNIINGVYINEINGLQVVTVEGTNPISYSSFNLFAESPQKIVIDIDQAFLPTSLLQQRTIPVGQGPLLQVRLGQFTPDTVRIVFDLTKTAKFVNQTAQDGTMVSFTLLTGSLTGKTIVIDPGHGQIQPGGWFDPGAVGSDLELHEGVVVLDIAQKLAKILEDEGARVILTHPGSTTLSLAGRAQVAADNEADIFVSIHANANVNRNINGTMTFFFNEGPNASASRLLAQTVQHELVKEIGRLDIGISPANFAVLRNNPVPAILVETAFVSNREEERLLADPQFRARAAQGIAQGITSYFNSK